MLSKFWGPSMLGKMVIFRQHTECELLGITNKKVHNA